jgi:hypothetical protein
MARITGKGGDASLGSTYTINFREWSATFNAPEIDVTTFQDTGKRVLGGIFSGNFSASGTLDNAGGGPHPGDGSTVDLSTIVSSVVLTADTACTYTFDALITSCDVAVAVDGEATATVNGVFDNRVTMAWVD